MNFLTGEEEKKSLEEGIFLNDSSSHVKKFALADEALDARIECGLVSGEARQRGGG